MNQYLQRPLCSQCTKSRVKTESNSSFSISFALFQNNMISVICERLLYVKIWTMSIQLICLTCTEKQHPQKTWLMFVIRSVVGDVLTSFFYNPFQVATKQRPSLKTLVWIKIEWCFAEKRDVTPFKDNSDSFSQIMFESFRHWPWLTVNRNPIDMLLFWHIQVIMLFWHIFCVVAKC